VADVVGRKLRMLGSAFQVLCITHLPQIAAYADTHFQIEKQVTTGRTLTTVQRLTPDDRILEIARMLGGEAITAGLRQSAREMLEERGQSGKAKAKGESESPPGRKAKRPTTSGKRSRSGPRSR
jgi:DNA repair protein RecN (Recombination protein N)